jgi:hypothetical protein
MQRLGKHPGEIEQVLLERGIEQADIMPPRPRGSYEPASDAYGILAKPVGWHNAVAGHGCCWNPGRAGVAEHSNGHTENHLLSIATLDSRPPPSRLAAQTLPVAAIIRTRSGMRSLTGKASST